MNSNHRNHISVIILMAIFLFPLTATARWTSVDPKASKYPSISPYVYTLNNPLKYVDPDGRDIALSAKKSERTMNFGHTDLFYQDGEGQWFQYNQGDYGVKIKRSDGPTDGPLLLRTRPWQDGMITESAKRSEAAHSSGELRYNFWSNNCLDAALDVVNESGAAINIDGAVTPLGWLQQEKKATVDVVQQQNPTIPSDATTVRIEQPKYEEVKKGVQN